MQVRLDIKRLLLHLGGAEGIEAKLKAAGIEGVSRKGIHKWGQRDNMPADRLAEILAAAALDGEPIDLYAFIVSGPHPQS